MFSTVSNIIKVVDLRKKIIFTLLMLIVFRIGSFIPVPNIDSGALASMTERDFLGLLNTFSGGALQNFSIFAMGIMPYITASIIVNLLAMDVIPKFAEWARQGEAGRRKMSQVTRYGTIVLGFVQGIGFSISFNNMYPGLVIAPSVTTYLVITITLTAGTAFLMWLGEQITEKGIGNGISIIIFAGIVAGFPDSLRAIFSTELTTAGDQLFLGIVKVIIIAIVVVLIVAGVIFVTQGVRRIPVNYAKRVVGRKMYGGQSSYIPFKVNSAGVIPVIFALSLLMFPATIAQFWAGRSVADWIIQHFTYSDPVGATFYVLLIIGFTYFYTFVQINPEQMAENMKKNGGFIPGVRPGKATAKYIVRVLNRITLTGSLFLAAVAVLPIIFTAFTDLPQSVQIGGTSLLIVVGVALDTMKQVESQLINRHYDGFIKK
ncbi:MAG: preprotein translocase subunit SecY [Vulcanibacillus sp.]